MKPQNKIFNLKEPSAMFMKEWKEGRRSAFYNDNDDIILYLDSGTYISFGGKTYFSLWMNVNGKFIQADEFYCSTTGDRVSQNEILASMITHVLPQKFIQRVIEFAQRF